MGDQWAVDSANSRAALQIHRKAQETNTPHTPAHESMLEYTEAQCWVGREKDYNRFRCVKPANAIIAHADFLNVNRIKSWWISFQIHFASASETTSRHLSELLSARFSLLCVCLVLEIHVSHPGRTTSGEGWNQSAAVLIDLAVRLRYLRGSTKTKVSGISMCCRSLQGSQEHSSQMSPRYRTNCLIDPKSMEAMSMPMTNCRLMITAPEHIAVNTAAGQLACTLCSSAKCQRCYSRTLTDGPVIGLVCSWTSTTDRFDILFLDSWVSMTSVEAGLGITFTPFHLTRRHKRGDATPSSTRYRNIQCASVLMPVQTDAHIQTDICMSSSISLSYTHANQPAHEHTHTHTLSHTQKHRYHSFSALNDFRSQLSHITGEEGVRPSIKELFKWNHVLWWFKANISLAHSCWMCSSEEPGLQVSEDALLLRCERRSAGARGVVNGVEMKVELGSSRAVFFSRVRCDVNVDHTEVFTRTMWLWLQEKSQTWRQNEPRTF